MKTHRRAFLGILAGAACAPALPTTRKAHQQTLKGLAGFIEGEVAGFIEGEVARFFQQAYDDAMNTFAQRYLAPAIDVIANDVNRQVIGFGWMKQFYLGNTD